MTDTPDQIQAAKLTEAARCGYSGQDAVDYAELLRGDSVAEVQEHAGRLASTLRSIAAAQEPPPDRAFDRSQGHGDPDDIPADRALNDFRDTMKRILR